MSRAAALREHDHAPNADQIIVLHDVTWEDYERVLEIRGDKSAPRINYLEGELEIMSPSQGSRADQIIHRTPSRDLVHRSRHRSDPFRQLDSEGEGEGSRRRKRTSATSSERSRANARIWRLKSNGPEAASTSCRSTRSSASMKSGSGAKESSRSTFSSGRDSRKRNAAASFPTSTSELLASMLDRDTLTQAVRDFRRALNPES